MTDYIAKIWDLTGDEPPLTPADERAAIQDAFGGNWYGEWLLAGGDRAQTVRTSHLGTGGWLTDHYRTSVHTSPDGLFICVREYAEGRACTTRPRPAPTAVRVGRLTWRQAEDILRATTADDGALFDLEVI